MLYLLLKLTHILAAIVAVGANLSYVPWLVRSARSQDPAQVEYALRGIKFLDDWLANPSYVLVLLTGLLMAYVGGYNLLETSWMLVALGLFGSMAVVGLGLYTPTLSRQIRVLDTDGLQSVAYRQIDRRQTGLGIVLFVMALTILTIMVLKPVFF
jgi:uncharacterized membrane protein